MEKAKCQKQPRICPPRLLMSKDPVGEEKKMKITILKYQGRFNTYLSKEECTKLFIMTKLRDTLSDLWFR